MDVVVSLLDDYELRRSEFGTSPAVSFGDTVTEHGMQWKQYRIRDKWVPGDTSDFLQNAVTPVVNWLRRGKTVHIRKLLILFAY